LKLENHIPTFGFTKMQHSLAFIKNDIKIPCKRPKIPSKNHAHGLDLTKKDDQGFAHG
jgi:hypothetical protein